MVQIVHFSIENVIMNVMLYVQRNMQLDCTFKSGNLFSVALSCIVNVSSKLPMRVSNVKDLINWF